MFLFSLLVGQQILEQRSSSWVGVGVGGWIGALAGDGIDYGAIDCMYSMRNERCVCALETEFQEMVMMLNSCMYSVEGFLDLQTFENQRH